MRPVQALSDLMRQVKQDSSGWVNQKGFIAGRFSWQAGYGAFSYSKSQLPRVIRYIRNQEKHHAQKSFGEEYLELLKTHQVKFNERYIFKTIRLNTPYLTARSDVDDFFYYQYRVPYGTIGRDINSYFTFPAGYYFCCAI